MLLTNLAIKAIHILIGIFFVCYGIGSINLGQYYAKSIIHTCPKFRPKTGLFFNLYWPY